MTPKYRWLLHYTVDEAAGEIIILNVKRLARRRGLRPLAEFSSGSFSELSLPGILILRVATCFSYWRGKTQSENRPLAHTTPISRLRSAAKMLFGMSA